MFQCQWGGCLRTFNSQNDLTKHLDIHVDVALPEPYRKPTHSSEKETVASAPEAASISLPETSTRIPLSISDSEDDFDDIKCLVCRSGKENEGNLIVLCDDCDAPYHQQCHRPPVSDQIVKDKHAKWFCSACLAETDGRDRHPAK